MNPYDLAWKGTTIAEKRELLKHGTQERDRLILEAKAKDGYLGLASTCVDIISTAKAAIKDANEKIDADAHKAWKALLEEALTISKEAVDLVLKEDRKDWSPSDYEVAGAIEVATSEGDVSRIAGAIVLFKEGVRKAKASNNLPAAALLYGQLVRAGIAMKVETLIESNLRALHNMIAEGEEFDPKVKTRLFRAMAEGAKFLAIQYAEEAGSPNQKLKAEQI